MKNIKIISCCILISLFASCNSEAVICETEIPVVVIPPEICNEGLLIMRADGETGEPRFSLDSLSKPINTPLVFQNIRQDQQDDTQFDVFNRPSNYDGFNANTGQYFIEFPLQQRLYVYDVSAQSRQELIVAGFYSAPIFSNNNLYAVTIDNFGYATNPANYSIETINLNDGSLTTIITNSFPLLSSFDWESMSSATDGTGMLYFISGTNLINFNTATSTTNAVELVPDFNTATNFQRFYGLEYRNTGNLLAIRERDNNQGVGLELVSIDPNNPTTAPTVIFDFMANGINLNSEFYATSYDDCDDTYYITSRDNNNTDITNFYEINLFDNTVKTESFDFYLMGISTKNN